MSLRQKGKGLSKRVKAILLGVAMALVVAVGGIATAVSLTRNNNKIGGTTADSVAMGDSLTRTAPSMLGSTESDNYKYTTYSTSTHDLTGFNRIPGANLNGAYYIDTPGKWLYAVDEMNKGTASYLSGTYVFAGGQMNFQGQTVTPAANNPEKPFTGIIYGNKTTIENAKLGYVNATVFLSGYYRPSQTIKGNYCGFFAFANDAKFYDLALNTDVTVEAPQNVQSVTGGLVACVRGTNVTCINVSSFISGSVINTESAADKAANGNQIEIGGTWGGILGYVGVTGTAYYNGCTYCGYLHRSVPETGNDVFYFGGIFGLHRINGSVIAVYNVAADFKGYIETSAICGGPVGAAFNFSYYTIQAKNVVCRLDITDNGECHTPDYGLFITVWSATASTNCSFENIYLYGNRDEPNTGVTQDGWLNAKDADGNLVIKNIVTNVTPATVGNDDFKTGGEGAFSQAESEEDVIKEAQKNAKNGTVVNDDGTVGSKNAPAADYSIAYVDDLVPDTSKQTPTTYNSNTGANFNNRTQTGATFLGWSVGSWTADPIMSFAGGGRIGNLYVYARWQLDGTKITATPTGAATQSITYGENATFKVGLTHPLVTGKARFVFDGWYKNGAKVTSGSNGVVITNTATSSEIAFTKPTVAQAGTYQLRYTLAANEGLNGIASVNGTYDITLNIEKATVTNPTFNTEHTYTGKTNIKYLIATEGASDLYQVQSGVTEAADAKTYTTVFALKDSANYKWETTTGLQSGVTLEGGESGTLKVVWVINPAQITGGGSSGSAGDEHDDPDDPDPDDPNPGSGFGSFVQFNVPDGGIVGLALNNGNNNGGANGGKGALTLTGEAWFTFEGGEKEKIEGSFGWKNPSEVISYKDFDFEAAESNGGMGIYKTYAVFTPEDDSIAPFERLVTLTVTGSHIKLLEVEVDPETGMDQNPGDAQFLWIDYDTTVKIAPKFGQSNVELTYYWGGEVQNKTITAQAPKGFNGKVYFSTGGDFSYIIGTNNVFTLDFTTVAGAEYYGRTFYIGYVPAENTTYTVYYVLEKTNEAQFNDGDFVTGAGLHYSYGPSSTVGTLESASNSSNPSVYKAITSGRTTDFVQYMENGAYLTTEKEAAFEQVKGHYEPDTAANVYLNSKRIAGDGSTVAVVMLKARYHTVTFMAIGAEPSMQTKSVKYGGKLAADVEGNPTAVTKPEKSGANFDGWFAAQAGGNPINFNNVTILDDVTYFAHFTNSDFYIVFDMNAYGTNANDNAATAAPNDYAINVSQIPSEKSGRTVKDRITWNYANLDLLSEFEAMGDFEYKSSADPAGKWGAGTYVLQYTVDSLTSNISLNVNTGKPSAVSYTFTDWYQDDVRVRSITAPINYAGGTPDEVITLKARWTKQSYSLVFDKQDGSRTTTVSGVTNITKWDDIFNKNATAQGLKAPTRSGYTFEGWYAEADCEGNEVTKDFGTKGWFSVYYFKDIDGYKTVNGDNVTYNFGTIKLYALWESVEIEFDVAQDLTGGGIGQPYVTTEYEQAHPENGGKIEIGVEVEVDIETDPGYKFSYLIVGERKRPVYMDAENRVRFTIASTDLKFEEDGSSTLTITAVFEEITYTITYDRDGGVFGTSSIVNSYTVTHVKAGVYLPNDMTKVGYNFAGWVYENADGIFVGGNVPVNGQKAYKTAGIGSEDDLYGKDLILEILTVNGKDWYANFTLKAVWLEKPAELRLYGANYADGNYGDRNSGYYKITRYNGNELKTGSKIVITSPVSESFYFMGWATSQGGDVVYAAELLPGETASADYVAQPVEYTIMASADGVNSLYAVWQVKDLSYVTVTASNNNSVYDGTGVKLSARTAKEYKIDDEIFGGDNIQIIYTWYRVKDSVGNMDYYASLFTVTKRIYIDDQGNEIGSITYGEDGQETGRTGDTSGNNYIEQKKLNDNLLDTCAVKQGAEIIKSSTELTSPATLNVINVKDAGRYVCVARLGSSDSIAFGEITVAIKKAHFSSVVFRNGIEAYDGTAKGIKVELANKNAAKTINEVGNRITLLDDSVVTVTYKYKLVASYGNPLPDVDGKYYDAVGNYVDADGYVLNADGESWAQEVINAGVYNVIATFEISNESNYTVINSISAELEITKKTLTNIKFAAEHDVADWTDDGRFSFVYDGKDYVIKAEINDTDINGSKLVDVEEGRVSLVVKIYEADNSGNKQTPVSGNAINAGKYVAEIASIGGTNGGNYMLGNVTKTQVFEIAKAQREYGLSFEDAVVTFDNKIHTIEVKSNVELPDSLKVSYQVEAVLDEASLTSYADAMNMPNDRYVEDLDGKTGTVTNGGRHAGTYTVTPIFTDAESRNYEPVEMEPATLTIEKASLYEFYATDEEKTEESGRLALLGTDFRDGEFAYVVGANRMMFINSESLLNKKDSNGNAYFSVRYNVYRIIEGSSIGMASGTEAELSEGDKKVTISASGEYEIEAVINYNSPLFKNDFKEVGSETVKITIKTAVIDRIEVKYYDAENMVQYIGEEFDLIGYVEEIDVYYQGDSGNMPLTGDDLVAYVKVIYDDAGEHSAFWKVGNIDLVYDVYGVKTKAGEAGTIKIRQKITEGVNLEYSQDGNSYKPMGEFGLDIEEAGNYQYRVVFSGIDGNGKERTLYQAVTLDGELTRGENKLQLPTDGLYDFSEIDVMLVTYKTVAAEDITWKYSVDGHAWKDLDMNTLSLPYVASEYYLGITFKVDNGNEGIAILDGEMILNAKSYNISVSDIYTNDDRYADIYRYYHIQNVSLGSNLTIEKHELSLVWEKIALYYTGEAQLINLESAGVLEPDKNDIGFTYEYFRVTAGVETPITTNDIVNAGSYRVKVSGLRALPDGDPIKVSNYRLPEERSHDFVISKAIIEFSDIWYEEASYGRDTSYQNNPHGLRTDSIRYAFGDNKTVEGSFYFVKDNGNGSYDRLTDKGAGEEYLKTAGYNRQALYAYSPRDVMNYEVKIGVLNLTVLTQEKKQELKVVKKANAVDFYIVNSMVYPDRIDVYEVYKSYYEEDGVQYGRLDQMSTYSAYANGHLITATQGYRVLSTDDSIEIVVHHDITVSITGSITFRVYKSQPTSITLSAAEREKIKEYKENWYVGEQFELPITGPYAVEFTLNFENGDTATLYFGDLTYTVSGIGFSKDNRFTEAGTATITFNYAGLTTTLQLEIKPKEDLNITTATTRIEKYDGTVKAVPELKSGEVSLKDGIPGVSYTYQISLRTVGANGQYVFTPVDRILEEGTYVVIYTFTVTNPRYNTPTDFRMTIEVKDVAYEAVFKQFTEAQLTSVYSGNEITPPTAELSHIKDLISGKDIENAGTVELTSITLNGAETKIKGVGNYEVVWTAKYNGEEIGTYKYTYRVTRAENSATFTVKNILVGDAVSYEVTNLKFGGPFNAATMITFSDNENSGWTSTVPTEVGVWYIRLEVQGTNDYTRLTIVKSFTISNKSLSSDGKDDGDVWVDVEAGDNGLAPGTRLEVSKVGQEELDALKIKKRTVLDGYDVALKTANGEDVELNGEITIKLLINKELRGKNLSVYLVTYDENNKATTVEIKGTSIEGDKYIVFSASSVGRLVITEKIATAPGGLIAGVSICAVIAAGLIVACVLVFLKKRG